MTTTDDRTGNATADDRATGRSIDLLDGEFYVDDPYPTYAWMREHAPLYWDATNELWGVSRYDDIVEIEKRKDRFINSDQTKGGYRPNIPADPAIIGLDDPLHQRRRNLVARRFTPRAVASWEDHVRGVVSALFDDALGHGGPVEVVSELAAPLPAEMIGLLLGFGEEMWPKLHGVVRADHRARRRTAATTTRTGSSRPWSSRRPPPSSTRPSGPARPTT